MNPDVEFFLEIWSHTETICLSIFLAVGIRASAPNFVKNFNHSWRANSFQINAVKAITIRVAIIISRIPFIFDFDQFAFTFQQFVIVTIFTSTLKFKYVIYGPYKLLKVLGLGLLPEMRHDQLRDQEQHQCD